MSEMISSDGPTQEDPMDTDKDFTPTVEMLVHEYDDEATLDEEEEIEPTDSQILELQDLQRESDMPLDKLLSMYGYNLGDCTSTVLDSEENIDESEKKDSSTYEGKDSSDTGDSNDTCSKTRSKLKYLTENHATDSNSENDEDDDYLFQIEDEEKCVRTGSEYQATVPEELCRYDDALPYDNEDKLLWNPRRLPEEDVENYLEKVKELKFLNSKNENRKMDSAKKLSSVFKVRKRSGSTDSPCNKDDEQALYLLLQCGFNVEEALRRQRLNVIPQTNMSLWSEDECLHFENGLCSFGKDFHQIQLHKVRTRSVEELVQFYYYWKKSERHDLFVSNFKMEKKMYNMHPQITDFMEKCNAEPEIEEQPDISSDNGDSSASCNNGEYLYNSNSGANRPLRHSIDDDLHSENSVTLLREHAHGSSGRSCVLR